MPSRVRRSAAKARGGSLREQLRAKAIERELTRIRKLLSLEKGSYSDLYVLIRARQELDEIAADDDLAELEEYEELEDGNE